MYSFSSFSLSAARSGDHLDFSVRSIPELPAERVVVFDPILHVDGAVVLLVVADDDSLDARVDDLPLAHHAAACPGHDRAVLGGDTGHVQRRAQHFVIGRRNDGIRLGMKRAAHLIALAAGDVQLVADAGAQIGAVLPPARRAVITGRNDDVILHNDRAEMPTHTGASLRDSLRDVQVVVFFGYTLFHSGLTFPRHAGKFSRTADSLRRNVRNSPYYLLYNILGGKSRGICIFMISNTLQMTKSPPWCGRDFVLYSFFCSFSSMYLMIFSLLFRNASAAKRLICVSSNNS